MELEKWPGLPPEVLGSDTNTRALLDSADGATRFVAQTENGEVFVALGADAIRLSMQRANGTYCLFDIPKDMLDAFLGSGNYSLSDLRDAIWEDPIVSGLSRDEATSYLGISEAP